MLNVVSAGAGGTQRPVVPRPGPGSPPPPPVGGSHLPPAPIRSRGVKLGVNTANKTSLQLRLLSHSPTTTEVKNFCFTEEVREDELFTGGDEEEHQATHFY